MVKHVKETVEKVIGQRLRAYRMTNELSQTDVGDALGVSFQQIQKYEKGINRISGTTLIKICKLMKITPNDLLGYDDGRKEEPDVMAAVSNTQVNKVLVALNALPKEKLVPAVGMMLNIIQIVR